MYLDVFSLLMLFIKTNSKSKSYTIQQYKRSSDKVVMYIEKLHHFCSTFYLDDGPNLGRKYLGNNLLWKVHQPIPAEYLVLNTAI